MNLKKRFTKLRIALLLNLMIGFFSVEVSADTFDKLSDLEGYYLIKVKTIDGRVDKGKKYSDFEGCDWDRVIIFDDGTTATCRTYSYTYSYRPKAALFGKQMTHNGTSFYSIKMLVGSDLYDMGVELIK